MNANVPVRPASSRDWRWAVLVTLAVALPAALARTTFLVVPTSEGLWRGIADPPTSLRILVSLALGAAVAALTARAPREVIRPLLVGLLAAAPLVPMWTGHGMLLLAFGPPLVRIVMSAALAVALVRAAEERRWRVPGPVWPAVAFAFYLAVGTGLPGPAGPQGDEPHYLTMAESLRSDGDLDLRDELETRAYAPFYVGTLAPHTSPASPPGHDYSIHAPGLPLLLLPAYALGGYPAARVFFSALAALTVWWTYRLARPFAGGAGAAAVLALTPPFAFYAVSLYPETPVACAAALLLLASRPEAGAGWRTAAAVAAAVVPWLHPKYLPMAALGLAFTVTPASWRRRALSFVALTLSVAGLLFFMKTHYGRFSLSAAYGGGFQDDVTPLRSAWGAPALLFDREFGLFAIAPVWLLAIPGAALLVRRVPGEGWRALLLAASAFAVNASFSMWWGGTCPPARFLVPCLPAFALLVAAAARERKTLAAALIGAGFGVVAVAVDAPRAVHNRADGESALLRVLARGLDLDRLLPSYALGEPVALLLSASLLAIFALGWLKGTRGWITGFVAYGLMLSGVRPGAILDRREATLALLDGYDDRALLAVSGSLKPESLAVPMALPGAPWDLHENDVKRSRRVDLAPGRYRVDIAGHIVEAARTAHVVRIDLVGEEERLSRTYLEEGRPLPADILDLPEGARRVRVEAMGIQGNGRLESVTLVPLSLVPRKDRRPPRTR